MKTYRKEELDQKAPSIEEARNRSDLSHRPTLSDLVAILAWTTSPYDALGLTVAVEAEVAEQLTLGWATHNLDGSKRRRTSGVEHEARARAEAFFADQICQAIAEAAHAGKIVGPTPRLVFQTLIGCQVWAVTMMLLDTDKALPVDAIPGCSRDGWVWFRRAALRYVATHVKR